MLKYLVAALLVALPAFAQQQPVVLSIEYYQQRILETDARAAALTYENGRLKAENDELKKKIAEAKK